MADTCIVCLGDLAISDLRPSSTLEDDDPLAPTRATTPPATDDTIIAHLLPCKHNLHNTCLKPWVERANSCPICRTDFNTVELRATLDGPCIDTYVVQDKKQTAEFDVSEFVPVDLHGLFEEEHDDVPRGDCLVCQQEGDDGDLLLCDGCNTTCHTYCCGLSTVPDGLWFCEYCHEDGTASNLRNGRAESRTSRMRLRQRLQDRASRRHARSRQSDYTRIWQTVLARTNIDLDFPFEDDSTSSAESAAHAREMREWTRRFQIAERQGGAARFRETAGTVLQSRNQELLPDLPAASREETRALDAFEVARESQVSPTAASSSRGTKRKSPTASPTEPEPSSGQERPLKRPRIRRLQDATPSARSTNTATAPAEAGTSILQTGSDPNAGGPSFLRQLLTEVQNSSGSVERSRRMPQSMSIHTPRTDGSPGPPSPTMSPAASDHPSPRLRSASPHSPFSSRPSSPSPGLTSRIEPIYVQNNPTAFSPVSPGSATKGNLSPISSDDRDRPSYQRRPSGQASGSEDEKRESGNEAANTTVKIPSAKVINLSYDDKAKVQKMVSAALKPLYHSNEIDTDQYTEINKSISRKMYDKIAQKGGLQDEANCTDWERIAAIEVDAAMKSRRNRSGALSEPV